MQINDQMPGANPVWLGYVAVPDVDAAVVDWTAAGGTVQMPAMDVPTSEGRRCSPIRTACRCT